MPLDGAGKDLHLAWTASTLSPSAVFLGASVQTSLRLPIPPPRLSYWGKYNKGYIVSPGVEGDAWKTRAGSCALRSASIPPCLPVFPGCHFQEIFYGTRSNRAKLRE